MNCFQKFLLFLTKCVYPSKTYGLENIPDGGALLVSNHLSVIDSVYIRRIFKSDGVYTLAKKELFEKKISGKILLSFGAIPVDRDKPDMKTLLAAANVLKRGDKLVIFPEGTRNKTGNTELLPFKGGSVVLAAKSKRPIVPIVIYKKAKIFRKTPVIIGEPFEFSEYYGKKLSTEEITEMEKTVADRMIALRKDFTEKLSLKRKKKQK